MLKSCVTGVWSVLVNKALNNVEGSYFHAGPNRALLQLIISLEEGAPCCVFLCTWDGEIPKLSQFHTTLSAAWFPCCHFLSSLTTEVNTRPQTHTYTIKHPQIKKQSKQHKTFSSKCRQLFTPTHPKRMLGG